MCIRRLVASEPKNAGKRGFLAQPVSWDSDITQRRAWAEGLCGHPDQVFARYLLEGIRHGFRMGYDGMDPEVS